MPLARRKLGIQQLEDRLPMAANFVSHLIAQPPIASNPRIGRWSPVVADFDGDGDADVLIASEFQGGIAWHENLDGKGTFGPRNQFSGEGESARQVRAVDIDGDGDLDVLTSRSTREDTRIAWYENADGRGGFGDSRIVDMDTDAFGNNFELLAVSDFDEDGDLDILASDTSFQVSEVTGRLIWYENQDGKGTFGTAAEIDEVAEGLGSIAVADVDGDGDADVQAFDRWYENQDGTAASWGRRLTGSPSCLCIISTGDMDGDGDPDLLAETPDLVWYENQDGEFDGAQPIATVEVASSYIVSIDLDQDGDQDVVSAERGVFFHENLGNGVFAESQSISKRDTFSLSIADVDGDSDLDIISVDEGDAYWHESILSVAIDEYEVTQETALVVLAPGVLANDSQVAIASQVVSNPFNGSLSLNHDGSFEYTPNEGFLGFDFFSYRALDSTGNQITGPTNVTVNVVEAARRPGDANADGRVTFDDFVILASNFGQTDALIDDGDFDNDGRVSFADFLILSANFEA